MIVIPFVLWQSVTGTLYLWSERWMDAAHPRLRFVQPGGRSVAVSEQIAAALRTAGHPSEMSPSASAMPASHVHHDVAPTGIGVQSVLLAENSNRTTAVLLQGANGLPYPVFVNPYTGEVLGQLSATEWLPGLTRALHGGWPLGDPGSWLLELGDGWAILMIVTGLYLWWPRGRGFLAGLWPRVRNGARVLVRDLHSCVAVWFSIVFLFFLVSAMPWTALWGEKILSSIEAATGQSSPAGFSPGGASVAQFSQALRPIDEAVSTARARGVSGTLDVRLAPWPDAPLFITNAHVWPSHERTLVADPTSGAVRGDYRNEDLPAVPRFVALGVHVHQADFGEANVWINTAFAASLVWLSVTGVISWWMRRPKKALGAPPRVTHEVPRFVLVIAVTLCVLFPLLGLSVLLVFLVDWALLRATRQPHFA
jgi:uncharacterized iron-regulated membrane protein